MQLNTLWLEVDGKQSNAPRDKLVGWSLWPILGVNHEQHVGETCPKIGSVCVVMSGGFGGVHVHALWAVEFHHGLPRDV